MALKCLLLKPLLVVYREAAFKWLFKKSYLRATSISHFEVAFSGTENEVGFERDFKVALFRSGFEVDF